MGLFQPGQEVTLPALVQATVNLEAQVNNLAERIAGLPTREQVQGFTVSNSDIAGTVAEMRAFLDKYAPHDRPVAPIVTEVVRDAQGFMRDKGGNIVAYRTDASGAQLFDMAGHSIRVVEAHAPFSAGSAPG
jgi:hypothetical protein